MRTKRKKSLNYKYIIALMLIVTVVIIYIIISSVSKKEKGEIQLNTLTGNTSKNKIVIKETKDTKENNSNFILNKKILPKFNKTNISVNSTKKKIVATGTIDKCLMDVDNSICRFVGQNVHFSDEKYIPTDLMDIKGDYLKTSKLAKLRIEALNSFNSMSKAFYDRFGKSITIVSGYRDYSYQLGIKSRGCPDDFCAKAGYSEHQTGLAVDLFDASTEKEFLDNKEYRSYFLWLQANAANYGFHNSYQKGKSIDGYNNEPWHWRYLGKNIAIKLLNNQESFTEMYINTKK